MQTVDDIESNMDIEHEFIPDEDAVIALNLDEINVADTTEIQSQVQVTDVDLSPAAEEVIPVAKDDVQAPSDAVEEVVFQAIDETRPWVPNGLPKDKKRHRRSISIAPDGEIPNSGLLKSVEDYRIRHGAGSLKDEGHVKLSSNKKKKKEDDNAEEDAKRLERKFKYREKLAGMIQKTKDEQAADNAVAEEDTQESIDPVDIDEPADLALSPKRKTLKKNKKTKTVLKQLSDEFDLDTAEEKSKREKKENQGNLKTLAPIQLEQTAFPEEVQFLEAMPWFNVISGDIIEEVEYKEGPYMGLKMKKLKVSPTADGLFPVISKVFLAENSTVTTRNEVLTYIEDTHDKFIYKSLSPIGDMFAGFLLTGFKARAVIKDFEIEFGLKCMREFSKYAGDSLDFVAVLLQVYLFGHVELRPLAKEFMVEYGIPDPMANESLLNEFYEIYGTHYTYTQTYVEEIKPWLHQRTPHVTDSLPSIPVSAATSRSRSSRSKNKLNDSEKEGMKRAQVEAAIDSKCKKIFHRDNIASDMHFDTLRFIRTQLKSSLIKQALGGDFDKLKSLTTFGNDIGAPGKTAKPIRVAALKPDAPVKEVKLSSTSIAAVVRPATEILKQPAALDIRDALEFFLITMEKKRQKELDDLAELAKREAVEVHIRFLIITGG